MSTLKKLFEFYCNDISLHTNFNGKHYLDPDRLIQLDNGSYQFESYDMEGNSKFKTTSIMIGSGFLNPGHSEIMISMINIIARVSFLNDKEFYKFIIQCYSPDSLYALLDYYNSQELKDFWINELTNLGYYSNGKIIRDLKDSYKFIEDHTNPELLENNRIYMKKVNLENNNELSRDDEYFYSY